MAEDVDKLEAERKRMVKEQIAGRGINDPAVLRAMSIVPREEFVPQRFVQYAYDDTPLPIPGKQTISQPYVVALMIALLEARPDDIVLEIGTGSGYVAALLSRIVSAVHSVERLQSLVDYARQRLERLGYDNVFVHQGDGTLGWPENAPYRGIIVSAGGPVVPESLKSQLAINGRLIIPIGSSERKQHLIAVTRTGEHSFQRKEMGAVAFVPLIGDQGW